MRKHLFKICAIALLYICIGIHHADAATINKPPNYLGTLAYWTFDGADMVPNIRDKSGNAKHGTLTGQSATTTIIGKIGQALQFDGTNDYASFGLMSELNNATQMTMSMWMYPTSSAGQRFIFFRQGAGNPGNNRIGFEINNGTYYIYAARGGNAYGYRASLLELNKWQHVTIIYDGGQSTNATRLRVLVDGVEKTLTFAGTIPTQLPDMTSDNITFRLGASMYLNAFYQGSLDDVRFYNRALNTTEVTALYNKGGAKINNSNIAVSNGLVGYWTFDGKDMTPNVRDISGQGNHGTLDGFTSTTTTPGKIGQALQFDDTDDHVTIGAPAVLNNLTVATYAFWVKRTTTAGRSIFNKIYTNITTNPYGFSNSIGIIEQCDTGGLNKTTAFDSVPLNEWVHVVITKDGTCNHTGTHIYLNGVESAYFYEDSGDALTANSYAAKIGGTSGGPGIIDDMRIYNRELSLSEIKQLFNLGAGTKANVSNNGVAGSNLIAHWTFDGKDMRPNVRDASGNGNHVSLHGQSSTSTVIGKVGQGLQFDGVNDYTQSVSTINFNSSIITIAFWMYWDAFSDNDDIAIELSSNFNNNDATFLIIPNASGASASKFSIAIQDSVGTVRYRNELFDRPTSGEWHHYIIVLDNSTLSGDISMYIDGVTQSSTIQGNTKDKSGNFKTDTLYFMSRAGSSLFGAGKLDDLRIYNKGLTATEAVQLYNSVK